jgi:hypothetical protein
MRKLTTNRVRKRAPPAALLPWPLPVEFAWPEICFTEVKLMMRKQPADEPVDDEEAVDGADCS